jgi:hypothetical protein
MYSIEGTTLIGVTKGTDGLWLKVLAPTSEMTLDTTASRYAIGCEMVNTGNSEVYLNTGTVAVPVWSETSGVYNTLSASITLSAAQIIAMYATPVVVLPAITGKGYVVDSMELDITRTASAFTGGGAVAVQYDSTANGAGTATTATIAATVVTGAAGRTLTARIPVVQSDIASASIIGKGLYISNATGAFAAGTGTAVVRVKYHLV